MAWVAVGAGELARALGGLDLCEAHDAPLDLRDGLLRDHDDVAVREPTGPQRRLVQRARKVVPLGQVGDPLERHHADPRTAQGMPVRRTPACAL